MRSLVDTIKELCKVKDITLAELERSLDFGNSTIRKWNTNKPNIEKLQKVADFFNVTLDFLVGRNISKNNDFFVLARGGDKLTDEDKKHLEGLFENTIDIYLKAKGIK